MWKGKDVENKQLCENVCSTQAITQGNGEREREVQRAKATQRK